MKLALCIHGGDPDDAGAPREGRTYEIVAEWVCGNDMALVDPAGTGPMLDGVCNGCGQIRGWPRAWFINDPNSVDVGHQETVTI